MVVWLFAGGGQTEVRGLVPFLEKHFAYTFERKSPIRNKPGIKPSPGGPRRGYGHTGQSLARQLKQILANALKYETCDLILVIDDLDCRDAKEQTRHFLTAIGEISGTDDIEKLVGFAAPEMEAWLIADWDNTIARDVDFRHNHDRLRHWLSTEKQVPFDAPETFSTYDPARDSCQEKLSDALIEAARQYNDVSYSKGIHTPRLLQEVNPEVVRSKCPLFQQLYTFLSTLATREITDE